MLDEEISRLYGLPLEEFTRERNEAARAARKAGQREEADAIGRLGKPSIVAWASNQLARDRRRDVDLLLDSGRRLIDSQRSSLEGQGRAELDQARQSLEKAVARLVGGARVLLEERASDATLGQIAETLRIGAISAKGREQLARGTLTEAMRGTGWDVLEALAADLPPGPAPKKTPLRAKPHRSTPVSPAQLDAARAAVREAKARRTEAARAVREAEREYAQAREALAAADARLDSARRALAAADGDVAQAERILRSRR